MRVGNRILGVVLTASMVLGCLGGKFLGNTQEVLKGESLISSVQVAAAAENTVTIESFVKKLEKKAGLELGTLLQEGEFTDLQTEITWVQAAVLANRADELKNGTDYDKKRYKEVVKGSRLTGLGELSAEEKKAVRLCFVKGIIAGDSKGEYSQSRAFRASDELNQKEAKQIYKCLKNENKRTKLSPDGQVLRTKNLPKNYKKYNYILESFPNEFYEMKNVHERSTYYYEPVNLKDYTYPCDMDKMEYAWSSIHTETGAEMLENYGNIWVEVIRTNLERRLNFDYRTVDEKWISDLAATYIYDDDAKYNTWITKHIKSYVENAKKNHTVVKADKIVVEPSTFYNKGDFWVRCYVRFKINSDAPYTTKDYAAHNLIYSKAENIYLTDLRKNQWYELIVDIPIGQVNGNQKPETYKIGYDYLGVVV